MNKILKKERTPLTREQRSVRLFLLLSFFIPVGFILISFIKMGIRPFGGNSLLGMDLWSQYFPMLRHQVESRRDLALSIFSWDGALGVDTFVQNAYYCNSPFNLLLLLSPLKYLVDAVDYIILLKFGLSGLAFALYCRYHFKCCDVRTVACSTAYALCSYTLAFISQIMWFDAVVFFPIILLGFERLMSEKKPLLYCLVLALTIYSGFYISFSICLFLVVYFFVYSAEHARELGKKNFLLGGCRFALYSLLAGGLAAFVLLPVYFGLGNTIASDIPAPTKPEFYNSFIDYMSKMFVATPASLQFDVPNIYSGCFVFVFLPLFLLNKKIKTSRKIIYSILLVFLFFSMDLNLLDYVWHGFHFPNQLPGRWTFIFSFVLLVMCCELLLHIDGIEIPALLLSAAVAILLYMIPAVRSGEEAVSNESRILSAIFIVLYVLILYMVIRFKDDKFSRTAALLLTVCMLVESFTNATLVLYANTELGDVSTYTMYDDDMARFKETYADNEESFARAEMYYNWTFDHCQLFGIKGLTYYSSTMDGDAYDFFRQLGYRVYAKNVSTVYCPYSPLLNSVFSVKYVVDLSMQLLPDYLVKKQAFEHLNVLVNEKSLPPVFASSEDILSWEPKEGDSPYAAQNRFFSAILGRETEVYKKLPDAELKATNASISAVPNAWGSASYSRTSGNLPVTLTHRFTVDRDGPVYLCHNYKRGDMTITAGGKNVSIVLYREPMKYLGELKAGDVVEVTVESTDVGVGTCDLELYAFDRTLFEQCYRELYDARTVTQESRNGLSCKVVNDGEQLLFTSVPLNGMTCQVDGKEVACESIGGYLAAVRVPDGEHTVAFTYHAKGLTAGVLLSVCCALALAGITVGERIVTRKKKKEKAKP